MDIIGNRNQSIKRINEIYQVLKKNDFGYLIEENTFLKDIPLIKNKKNEEAIRALDDSVPVKMRKVFEELGPAFIKLGQMLSTRPDLVGIETAKELEKLTDNTPITPFDEVLAIIEKELNDDPMNIFESIDEVPLGSASIGQVHKGVLKYTNEEVAIKIQKPGSEEIIQSDIKIMKFLATRINRYIRQMQILNLPEIINEFERSIFKEIDYIEELINMEHLAFNFRKDNSIHIPTVYNEYSTDKLIVMELIKGEDVAKVIESDDEKYDKKLIAKRGVQAYFKQVILDGFFHADPHPGNLIIMENNVVCFIDMGMMGNLDEDFRRNLAQLLLTLTSKNSASILNQLVYMDVINKKQITSELKSDVNDLMNRYYSTELSNSSGMFSDLLSIMIKHQIKIPREFINIGRGITLIEKIGEELDPNFNPERELKKLSKQIIYKHYSPSELTKSFTDYIIGTQHLIKNLPDRINSMLYKVEEGEISVNVNIEKIDRLTDKLSYSVIIAALIIGSSLAILADKGPKLLDMSMLGLVGFIISACLGLFVVLRFLDHN